MTNVCLVFDDGFAQSCSEIAKIFEARGLRASFAVLVDSSDIFPNLKKGDFDLWNEFQERGHIIDPHGYDHSDLSKIPFGDAKVKIDACLDYFTLHLQGFDAGRSIYHLTYNRSTPQVDQYLLTKFQAIRTTGPKGRVGSGMNNEDELSRRIYNCAWMGPDRCDEHLNSCLKLAELKKPKLFMYMLHGLDNEGWGPIGSNTLKRVLDYLLESSELNYIDTSAI